ncbi:hypothetical protein TIFTF001_019725 [Ficus carica]|uniref:Uncharacterized protein n=1 Tax=Ficus carica TaxID=3494 RepID=A0AA88AQU5_FICCA|nr:hypothetical protein TIFTF001_019725 [Ficus carica]
MIKNHEKELTPEGLASKPWSLCTVKQVEELKSLLKVLPIWSTGIFIAATTSQHSFSLIQASTTNRHLTTNFQIPAGSFVVFSILTLLIWVAHLRQGHRPDPLAPHKAPPRDHLEAEDGDKPGNLLYYHFSGGNSGDQEKKPRKPWRSHVRRVACASVLPHRIGRGFQRNRAD